MIRNNKSIYLVTQGYPFKKGDIIKRDIATCSYIIQKAYRPRWWKTLISNLVWFIWSEKIEFKTI